MSLEAHRHHAPAALTVGVVTLSDSRETATDTSGATIAAALAAAGHQVQGPRILREDPRTLPQELAAACGEPGLDAVIVSGGTGLAPRDLAFEILSGLYARSLPGFGELFRALSYAEIGSAALLSRASAGVVGRCLVFSLPGSQRAVQLALEKLILPELAHAVGELRRPPEGHA
jgi:molybdopterin adenylyltransferase